MSNTFFLFKKMSNTFFLFKKNRHFLYVKTQIEGNEEKIWWKACKINKKYFPKCSLTFINYFVGGEFENDHCFSKF